jgi:hypothetical protein
MAAGGGSTPTRALSTTPAKRPTTRRCGQGWRPPRSASIHPGSEKQNA